MISAFQLATFLFAWVLKGVTSRLTADFNNLAQLTIGVALAIAQRHTHRVSGEAARNPTVRALFG